MGIYLISMYTKSSEFVSYLVHLFPEVVSLSIWQSDSFPQIGSFEQQNQFSDSFASSVVFGANVALNVLKRWHISLFTTFFD